MPVPTASASSKPRTASPASTAPTAGTPLRVLSLQKGADTGGQAIRIKRAFERHAPDWSFRCMTQPPISNYIDYPYDLRWSNKTVRAMWPAVDVLHLHNSFGTIRWSEQHNRRLDHAKPAVLHYHGTQFRQHHAVLMDEQRERRGLGIVSTLDLHLLDPDELEWLPAPYDLDWLAGLRRHHGGSTIRIAHAPTNREIKSTAHFLAAIARLQSEGHDVEADLIEHASWAECLARKATADIYFDQSILGYGCNAIEAWGMGIPVVAGVDRERAAALGHPIGDVLGEYRRRFGELPFYPATEATIYDALLAMVTDPGLRATYAQRGQQHARRYHDEAAVVRQLQAIYHRAVERFGMERAA